MPLVRTRRSCLGPGAVAGLWCGFGLGSACTAEAAEWVASTGRDLIDTSRYPHTRLSAQAATLGLGECELRVNGHDLLEGCALMGLPGYLNGGICASAVAVA